MEEIVYFYCWRGIITIVRLKNGEWEFRYTISKFFNFLNEKNHLGKKWHFNSRMDCFDAGRVMGMKCEALLKECKESYEKAGQISSQKDN